MKKKLYIIAAIVFLSSMLFFLFTINNESVSDNSELEIETVIENAKPRAAFVENYIHIQFDSNNEPISIEAIGKKESDFFIENLNKIGVIPENILKVGNELFFVSSINKGEDSEGVALFTYDVILRKFAKLYFYEKKMDNVDNTLVLKAIDFVNNKLVLVLQNKDIVCSSLWLEQPNNFYTFDLWESKGKDLVEYVVPEWKKNEELVTYAGCDM